MTNQTLATPPASKNITQTEAAALSLKDVHLTLPALSGAVQILNGVDLRVAVGETVSIIGPSGSGKSSMISIAAGLEAPTSGTVELLGSDLSGMNEDELARLRRGRATMIFQSFHLLPTMTALDNVRAPLEIASVNNSKDLAQQALADVKLDHRMDHYPGQMSGGEQQRVAVARALACGPDIVFADEPTGNLDEATGQHVADLLFAAAEKRNTALVLVTHDTVLAARAMRTLTMRSGRLT